MSLIRQVTLLLATTLLLALLASVGVTVGAARDVLETEISLKNSDNATALAQVVSQQRGQREAMVLAASAQFDTGYYRSVRLRDAEGRTIFERQQANAPVAAPRWFVRLLPIDAPPGIAQVSDGWRALGSVELASQTAYAHDELWSGGLRAALALVLVGVVAGGLAAFGVARIRRPLDRTVEQAVSLQQGEYRTVPEPTVPELRRLTRAMNAMVERLRTVFEGQAAQVESLRRQATCDPLTGLANRAHFLAQLAARTTREDGPAAGGLVLLRLSPLAELNASLGRDRVDRLLIGIGEALGAYPERAPGTLCGRLNGADFALALPEGGVALETAQAILGLLRVAFAEAGAAVSVAAGVVETRRDLPLGGLLSAADLALARAESGPPYTVESAQVAGDAWADGGEHGWQEQLRAALDRGAGQLGAYPVVDRAGRLVHLECPLRLVLDAGAPPVVAAHWLPLALRSRLTAEFDELALSLALAAIARDGRPRGINLAPASLLDSGLAARFARHLGAAPDAAARLWIEVPESALDTQFDLVREFARVCRAAHARIGIEHAGERLARIERLFDAGLDYVKLDAAVGHGVGHDPARAGFVAGLATMLHGLALQVIAEGVTDGADAAALFEAGVDAVTGPWVDPRQPLDAAPAPSGGRPAADR